MKRILFILVLLLFALPSMGAEKDMPGGDEKPAGEVKREKPAESPSGADSIDDLVPEKSPYLSLPLLLGLDVLVPGGGHFYRKSYWMGSGFLVLKVAGAYSIYHFYNQWTFYRSLYFSAKKANADIDPDHQLLFKVPGKGYKTVDELKHLYDSSAQNITFAVVGNILVYSVSLVINYVYYKRNSGDSIPTFNLALSTLVSDNDIVVSLGYTYRL